MEIAEKEKKKKLVSGVSVDQQQVLRKQISDIQQRMRSEREEVRSSSNRLQEFSKQLFALQSEEVLLINQRDELRIKMAGAKRPADR